MQNILIKPIFPLTFMPFTVLTFLRCLQKHCFLLKMVVSLSYSNGGSPLCNSNGGSPLCNSNGGTVVPPFYAVFGMKVKSRKNRVIRGDRVNSGIPNMP